MRFIVEVFVFCVIAFALTAAASKQIQSTFRSFAEVETEINNMYLTMQPREHTVFHSTPTVNSLQNGEMVFVSTNGAVSLFARVDGSTWSVKLGR